MKKKRLILALFVVLLAGLTWFALNLQDGQGASDARAFNFKIEDTNTVSKIVITDAFGQQFTLVKTNDSWTDSKGGCVSKTNVSLILEALNKIEFKGYLPQKSEKRFTELMASSHIKVEIFQDGEWTKSWSLGPCHSPPLRSNYAFGNCGPRQERCTSHDEVSRHERPD